MVRVTKNDTAQLDQSACHGLIVDETEITEKSVVQLELYSQAT